jgi:hypothetical protein
LIVFLYYYSFGDVLVIRRRRAGRKSVLGRLAALKTRFEGLATQTDQLLQFRWWQGQSVLQFLSSCEAEFHAEKKLNEGSVPNPASGSFKIKGTFFPEVLVRIPSVLRAGAQMLDFVCTTLRRGGWNERRVGRALYLHELLFYWSSISAKKPSWKDVSALVEAAHYSPVRQGTPWMRRPCA